LQPDTVKSAGEKKDHGSEGMAAKNILITGAPGSGKSSVIAGTVDILASMGLRAGGIICPEMREGGTRIGFKMVDLLTGAEVLLAHVNMKGGPTVSKYCVNLAGVDAMSKGAIEDALSRSDFIVIDEIGPMEVLSEGFRKAVLLALGSPKPVLAAIHMKTSGGFIGSIKSRSDVELITIDRRSREALPEKLASRIGELVRRNRDENKNR